MKSVYAALVFVACTAPAYSQGTSSPGAAFTQAFTNAYNEKNVRAITALFSDDAVLLTPDAAPVQGRSAIEAHYKAVFTKGNSGALKRSSLKSDSSGNLAWDAGTFTLTFAEGSSLGQRVTPGKYLLVFKRVGTDWKIASAAESTNRAGR